MNNHASMNRVYRLIYSRVLNAWVAVSEITRGQGKGGRSARRWMLLAGVMTLVPLAQGAPTGGTVTAGVGKITQAGSTTTINQGSQSLNLSWTGFNISPSETVDFIQPGASSVAVNRITSTTGSQILGHLNANGQVYLIDPNGILFGKGAQVNVGGLVASTFDLSGGNGNSVMLGGKGLGDITNLGSITAGHGGYVALLGHQVLNEGTVTAQLGSIVMAGGNAFTLTFSGSQVGVVVSGGQLNDLAKNGGILQANGGNIVMTAGAKAALLASAVNNDGIIEAETIGTLGGHIQLLSGMGAGSTTNNGRLDASAPQGGDGGFIETSGQTVSIGNQATITTQAAHGLNGSWLIDPNDFTIAASGGDITGTALSTALGLNSVTIQTSGTTASCTGVTCTTGSAGSGNISVNDAVSWSANTLTLNAWNNINVNSLMNVTGAGTLSLLYGQSAANAGNGAAYNVNAPIDLASTAHFITKLGNDTTGAAATPVTWTILDSIPNPILQQGTGMTLSQILAALGGNYVLGSNMDATPTHSWNGNTGPTPIGVNTTPFTGIFDGLGHVISNYAINQPTASYIGLFGYIGPGAVIRNVGLTGVNVSGGYEVGALVGYNNGGTVANDYVTGTVSGITSVGGMVGYNQGVLTQDYATTKVTGITDVGGFLGYNAGTVSNAYATGVVSGSSNVGGFLGYNLGYNAGTVSNTYATGAVSGTSAVGGLVGTNAGTLTDNFYDMTTTGQTQGVGGVADVAGQVVGLTATQMQIASNFAGFTFSTTAGAAGNNWVMVDANGTLNNAGGALGGTFPMLASEYSTTINNGHQLQLMAMNLGGNYTLGSNIDLSATSVTGNPTDIWATSAGFVPIGNSATNFTGTLDGQGHTIGNLTINQPTVNDMGLFGMSGVMSTIRNVGLVGGSVSGAAYVGSFVGQEFGTLTSSYSTKPVLGASYVGGLVGSNHGTLTNDYAMGSVSGSVNSAGGLVGRNAYGTLTDSYATGSVSGGYVVGGLVGYSFYGTLTNSYATGAVRGTNTGGLLGGGYHPVLTNNFYDTTTTGQTQGVGGVADVVGQVFGMTTAQMQVMANFTSATVANGNVNPGWNVMTPVWGLASGQNNGLPVLCALTACSTLAYVTPTGSGSSIYGTAPTVGYTFVDATGNTLSLTNATVGGTANYTGEPTATSNVGSYGISYSGGLTLGGTSASNYVLQPYGTAATWNVTPLALTGTIGAGSSVYGSPLVSGGVTFTNAVAGNVQTGVVSVNTTGHTSSSGHLNAGTYTGIETLTGLSGGTDTADYTFAGITGNYTVSALALNGAIAAGSSIYGNAVTPGAVSFTNALTGDAVSTTNAATVVSTAANQSSSHHLDAGAYDQTVAANGLTGADAGNYSFAGFATPTANYTVSQLALTASSIANGNSVYGSTVTPGAISLTGVLTGDVVSGVASIVSPVTSTSGHLDAGTYDQTVAANGLTGADAGNYSFAGFTTPTANYTVNALALNGAIAAGSSIYGNTVTPGAVNLTGVLTGDLVRGVASIVSPVTSTSGHLDAGTYDQTVAANGLTGADAGNYSFAGFTTGTANYTVNALALNGAIAAGSSIYGNTVTPGAVSFTNALTGDGVSTTNGATVVSTAANQSGSHHLDAGTYNQTVAANGLTGADAGNYSFAGFTTGTANYTVTPGLLTYVANPLSASAGSALPALTGTVFGFVAGDDVGNATTGSSLWTTSATLASLPGTYAIEGSGLTARNYTLAEASGNARALTLNAVSTDVTSDVVNESSYQQTFLQGTGQSGPLTQHVAINPGGIAFNSGLYQIINGGLNVGQ